jgi:uroporphyrinogen-III synthase
MIDTGPVEIYPALSDALTGLQGFDWLVLTSARAVPALQELARQAGFEFNAPPVAAVGAQTTAAARRAGWDVKFQPTVATSAALAAGLSPVENQEVLLARTNIASRQLADTLRARGASVTDLPVYSTHAASQPHTQLDQLLRKSQIGYIIFASVSAIVGFERSITQRGLSIAKNIPAVAIGPATAAAATATGFRHVRPAPEPNIHGIIAALRSHPVSS